MRQFSNSNTLLALLADFDQWVDVSQFSDEFLANVWDISTAQGFGLDIWGRILGQSRYLQIEQTPGDNFGWNINPVGGVVNAINQEFGIGDGTTVGFQLRGPDHQPATNTVVIASMTRQDWQGVQQIYNTPRTNVVQQSTNLSASPWGLSSGSLAASSVKPDGVNPLYTYTTTAVGAGVRQSTLSVVSGNTYTVSFLASAGPLGIFVGDGTANFAGGIYTLNGAGAVVATAAGGQGASVSGAIVQLAPGLYLCSLTFTATVTYAVGRIGFGVSNGSTFFNVIFPSAASGSATAGYAQAEAGPAATSRIPTTTVAVTVTDWSVNGTGFVTLAQAPQGPTAPAGGPAVLRWNGTYVGTVIGTQWKPWSQAPWYGGAAAGTTAFPLQDDAYRQLLLVKAAANIASSDCPSINALMRSMFGSRGRCYVGYDPANPMHIGYHYEFFPTPVEKSIIESGLFPQPAGTTAEYIYQTLSYSPFGFAGANRGADPEAVTGWSQSPFYQP